MLLLSSILHLCCCSSLCCCQLVTVALIHCLPQIMHVSMLLIVVASMLLYQQVSLVGWYWQDLNPNDNTNNESALTKWSKKMVKLWQICIQSDKDDNDKTGNKERPDEPPKGSWRMKVPLGHAISTEYSQQSQHQGLAPSSLANCFKLWTGEETLNCETRIWLNYRWANLGSKLILNPRSWLVSCGFQQKSHWRPLE